ncbi:hypothetical protein [Actinomadura kijaniata]|uniref:hypothetical protein n=1 Tax=Actinomadura kijaniata TaxID=46161 RepID=UPI00082BCFCA|nr:hypothetical protein [Actinomadura kijaniata]
MILWMRVHRVAPTTAGLALMLALVAVAGGSRVPAPNLLQGMLVGTPLAAVLPLLVAGLLAHGLASGADDQAAVAVRPADRYRLLYVLAVCGVAALAGLALSVSGAQPLGAAAARNLTGYTGLALVGGALLGRHAAVALPTAYLLLVVMTGAPVTGEPPLHVWPLAASGSVAAAALAGVCLAVGLFLTGRNARNPRRGL